MLPDNLEDHEDQEEEGGEVEQLQVFFLGLFGSHRLRSQIRDFQLVLRLW